MCLIQLLGGNTSAWALDPAREPEQHYWFRVWAVRGLLWAWLDTAQPARDEAWRVREMAAKVIARHVVDDLLADVAPLRDDPVPRVREAAARAVMRITRANA